MTDVIIIGAGGHAAEIDEYIQYSQKVTGIKEINVLGFIDDNPGSYSSYQFSAPYLSKIQNHQVRKGQKYIMGIAGLQYRRFLIEQFTNEGAEFVTFIHPTTYVSKSAMIGIGVVIGPHVNIGPNVKVGNYTLVNSRCSLGHDTIIGDYNFVSPNVCFSGFTKIGNENLFGINCCTIPSITLGSRNKIAAGMVLDQNVGDDSVIFYRYKEKVIAVPKTNL
jgi:sugar O-acyltransferase (sialic acid O-acetyltransferase NeuD family)